MVKLADDDSKLVAITADCPECGCHALHDVLNAEVIQCKNGACQHQWPVDA